MHLYSSTHLTVLIELTAEGDGEVGGCAGRIVAGKQVLVVVEGSTPALTDLHVLEAGLHTTKQERAALVLVLQRSTGRDLAIISTLYVYNQQINNRAYCELCGK